jgi:hypothetical protein
MMSLVYGYWNDLVILNAHTHTQTHTNTRIVFKEEIKFF